MEKKNLEKVIKSNNIGPSVSLYLLTNLLIHTVYILCTYSFIFLHTVPSAFERLLLNFVDCVRGSLDLLHFVWVNCRLEVIRMCTIKCNNCVILTYLIRKIIVRLLLDCLLVITKSIKILVKMLRNVYKLLLVVERDWWSYLLWMTINNTSYCSSFMLRDGIIMISFKTLF